MLVSGTVEGPLEPAAIAAAREEGWVYMVVLLFWLLLCDVYREKLVARTRVDLRQYWADFGGSCLCGRQIITEGGGGGLEGDIN